MGQSRKISVADLHDYLDDQGFRVDARTVQRDLNELSGPLFPIRSDGAKPAGWSWDKDASPIQIPTMQPAVALTFKLAETYLSRVMPQSALKHLKPYFEAAQCVLSEMGEASLSDWPRRVRILPRGQALLSPVVREEVLNIVYQALLEGRRFRCKYLPRDAESARDYEVNPLGLVERDQVLYLVCCLWQYDDTKLLALHRMLEAELLETEARTPDGFDLDQYIARGEMDIRRGESLALEALFETYAAYQLRETPLSTDQKILDLPDGRVRLMATVADTAQLRWWLLGFGDGVEVVGPKELRDKIACIVKNSAERYNA